MNVFLFSFGLLAYKLRKVISYFIFMLDGLPKISFYIWCIITSTSSSHHHSTHQQTHQLLPVIVITIKSTHFIYTYLTKYHSHTNKPKKIKWLWSPMWKKINDEGSFIRDHDSRDGSPSIKASPNRNEKVHKSQMTWHNLLKTNACYD